MLLGRWGHTRRTSVWAEVRLGGPKVKLAYALEVTAGGTSENNLEEGAPKRPEGNTRYAGVFSGRPRSTLAKGPRAPKVKLAYALGCCSQGHKRKTIARKAPHLPGLFQKMHQEGIFKVVSGAGAPLSGRS